MIILKKGLDTKILSESSKLIEKLIVLGWIKETKEKDVKDGKPSKLGS